MALAACIANVPTAADNAAATDAEGVAEAAVTRMTQAISRLIILYVFCIHRKKNCQGTAAHSHASLLRPQKPQHWRMLTVACQAPLVAASASAAHSKALETSERPRAVRTVATANARERSRIVFFKQPQSETAWHANNCIDSGSGPATWCAARSRVNQVKRGTCTCKFLQPTAWRAWRPFWRNRAVQERRGIFVRGMGHGVLELERYAYIVG